MAATKTTRTAPRSNTPGAESVPATSARLPYLIGRTDRIVMLGLTDEALALLALCDEAVSRLEKEMLQGIDDAHAELLHDLLLQCGRNLR